MANYRAIALFSIFLLAAPFSAWADAYLSAIDDIPLMPGLAEVNEGMRFDVAQGRIVEAWAQGRVARQDAAAFYDAALPQLGWIALGDGVYRREGESLTLRLDEELGLLTVQFSVSPL